jgi:hypothetical protein
VEEAELKLVTKPRHWREVFDPNGSYIFTRRVRVGAIGIKTANIGDAVTPELMAFLGVGRLARWYKSKLIRKAGGVPPVPEAAPPAPEPVEPPAAPEPQGLTLTATAEPGEMVTVKVDEDGKTETTVEPIPDNEKAKIARPVVTKGKAGWYSVEVPGEKVPRKVRGDDALEKLLDKLDEGETDESEA